MARLAKYAAMAEAIHSTATRKKPTGEVLSSQDRSKVHDHEFFVFCSAGNCRDNCSGENGPLS